MVRQRKKKMKAKTLMHVIAEYSPENYTYERLYKRVGVDNVFRIISDNKNDPLFREFITEDVRYWIEDEPRLVRKG